ncbi:unnamed protein product [Aphis gossypii]|uniref:Uncharacterized protein n=1 Tax=Aphis gossypii TaxID=80765 RepID=A0A9P0NBT3_APHGO|nr:unnamed protein product [Aphis gossypii]
MTDDDVTDMQEDELLNMPKNRSRRVSLSSSRKSNGMTNTPPSASIKRLRKPVNRFGDIVDLNEITLDCLDSSEKKHLRQSVTPRSGSKACRSILQDIPENKEIEISTPKPPRKTPKSYVKNLTASVGKRLNGGARIPCSALEKARENLHLHAAPKHLPCREFEYKSIHSFLVRKINVELTGVCILVVFLVLEKQQQLRV